MINVIGALLCAFVAGLSLAEGNMVVFSFNMLFCIANFLFVWHHYSKHKEHNP